VRHAESKHSAVTVVISPLRTVGGKGITPPWLLLSASAVGRVGYFCHRLYVLICLKFRSLEASQLSMLADVRLVMFCVEYAQLFRCDGRQTRRSLPQEWR